MIYAVSAVYMLIGAAIAVFAAWPAFKTGSINGQRVKLLPLTVSLIVFVLFWPALVIAICLER